MCISKCMCRGQGDRCSAQQDRAPAPAQMLGHCHLWGTPQHPSLQWLHLQVCYPAPTRYIHPNVEYRPSAYFQQASRCVRSHMLQQATYSILLQAASSACLAKAEPKKPLCPCALDLALGPCCRCPWVVGPRPGRGKGPD